MTKIRPAQIQPGTNGQVMTTVAGVAAWAAAAAAGLDAEAVMDYLGGVTTPGQGLVAGTGASVTYDDATGKITISSTGGGGGTGGGLGIDIQIFTANGTYTKPPNAKTVTGALVGGGGGGGAGRMAAGTSQKTGGAGGGGGGRTVETLPATAFGATEAVTVGGGGVGAAGLTVAGNGAAGSNGTGSSIGSVLAATGGLGGAGGTTAASSTTTPGGSGTFTGGTGGPGQGGDPISTGGASGGSAAGGGGGGGNATSSANGGGTGGAAFNGSSAAAGGTGGAAGAAGSPGTSSAAGYGFAGSGGGGGGASAAAAGGAGANGGGYGGGGGGGGAGATSSGGGGSGAGGMVIVTTYCEATGGSSGGGGGGILDMAVVNPNPGGAVYSSSTTAAKIVDSSALKVTFVAPSNGKALIRLLIRLGCSSNGSPVYFFVTDNVGTLTPYQNLYAYQQSITAGTPGVEPYVGEFPITGLTPGATYTFYLGWSQASTATWTIYAGQSGYGSTVMVAETVGLVSGGGGGATPADLAYVHNQGTPANVWSITHPLSFWPNVTVVDSTGAEVEGDVVHLTPTTLSITFSAAFSGTAYLS